MPEVVRYRVTHHVVQNLLLTAKQKFCFGLARPGQVKTELMFLSKREVLDNVICHPVAWWKPQIKVNQTQVYQ